jgi:hypothetical protein
MNTTVHRPTQEHEIHRTFYKAYLELLCAVFPELDAGHAVTIIQLPNTRVPFHDETKLIPDVFNDVFANACTM